jgi:hypothetical protein
MEQPYLEKIVTTIEKLYNIKYGDDRVCECGHVYYRHFDSYDDNFPCGCKYCFCYIFIEKV